MTLNEMRRAGSRNSSMLLFDDAICFITRSDDEKQIQNYFYFMFPLIGRFK